MIDRKHIGTTFPAAVLEVEKGRLAFFARTIGETDPIYTDEAAARAAGHPSIPAPPTFLMTAEFDAGTLRDGLVGIGVDLDNVLHGEQQFAYLAPVYAGDTISVHSRFTDIYGRKSLDFIVKESVVTNQHGVKVATMRSVIVVRNRNP